MQAADLKRVNDKLENLIESIKKGEVNINDKDTSEFCSQFDNIIKYQGQVLERRLSNNKHEKMAATSLSSVQDLSQQDRDKVLIPCGVIATPGENSTKTWVSVP